MSEELKRLAEEVHLAQKRFLNGADAGEVSVAVQALLRGARHHVCAATKLTEALAQVAALREALDSAKFFWRGEYPGEGPTAQMVTKALADTDAAARAHDEKVHRDACVMTWENATAELQTGNFITAPDDFRAVVVAHNAAIRDAALNEAMLAMNATNHFETISRHHAEGLIRALKAVKP